MQDNVVLLGVKGGPAIRPGSSMPTSHLLRMDGQTIVVDAGLGCSRAIVGQGVALTSLDAIVITHLHSDHYLELGPLLHTCWTTGQKTPVDVYGPAGLAGYWQGFLASMAFDIDLRVVDEGRPHLRELVNFHVLTGNDDLRIGDLCLRSMRNVHPPIADSFALRFDGSQKSVTFSGDTFPMPEMVEFARGSDLLIHEAMLTDGVDALCARVGNAGLKLKEHLLRSHSAAHEVGRIATQAGVKALALNHLVPDADPDFTLADWQSQTRVHWDGPLFVGQDGMVIEF